MSTQAEEELLDLGPRRLPRWVMPLGAVVLVVFGGWTITHLGHDGGRQHAPQAVTSPTASVSTSASVGPFAHDEVLAYVYERARDPEPAQSFVRTDTSTTSCELVPIGTSPERRISRYVRTAFPHMRVQDVARVIDKFAGLCVLELRARDDTGTALIVRVVAPIVGGPHVTPWLYEGSGVAVGAYTHYVRLTTNDGWAITVGSSGPIDAGPSQYALLTVARQRSLLW